MGLLDSGAVLVAIALLVVAVFFLMSIARFMGFIRQVPPNQALIITGVGCRTTLSVTRRRRNPQGELVIEQESVTINYRIVKGGMTIVLPMLQKARQLDLRVNERKVKVDSVLSNNAVPITVEGVVQLAIGEDENSIFTAARLQLDKSLDAALDSVAETLQGHLRAIIGLMSVEDAYKNREMFAQRVYEVAYDDVAGLGFQILSFIIRDISDAVGFLDALGKPEIAVVLQRARIAEADADREATLKEQEAARKKSEYEKTTNVARAEYDAEVAGKRAIAQRAGEISLAEREQVLEQQRSEAARIAAGRRNMELEGEVRRPADAERYKIEQQAEATRFRAEQESEAARLRGYADADVSEALGQAQAEANKAKGLAEAEVIKASRLAEADGTRAQLLAEAAGRRELARSLNAYDANALRLVLGQALLAGVPAVAESFGKAFANIDQIRLVEVGGGNGGNGGEGTVGTVERFMDTLPTSLFKFLQGATALLGGPIDDLIAGAIIEAGRKRGVEVTPEQETAIKEEAADLAQAMEQLAEEAPAAPGDGQPQARPIGTERRRRLTKRQGDQPESS
ncbi:MAG: flotillin family protein [Anaerolineae bacterium]